VNTLCYEITVDTYQFTHTSKSVGKQNSAPLTSVVIYTKKSNVRVSLRISS